MMVPGLCAGPGYWGPTGGSVSAAQHQGPGPADRG